MSPAMEDTGIHLHRDRFQRSLASPGRGILHIVQGPVIVNVRRVEREAVHRGCARSLAPSSS